MDTGRQVKIDFNHRMHREKRWPEFNARREAYRNDGLSSVEAFRKAAMEFMPLDGSPHELEGVLDQRTSEAKAAKAAPKLTETKAPPRKSDWTLWQGAWKKIAIQVDPRRSCGPVESVQWVYDHAGTDPADLLPDEVPSLGALRMLLWVSSSIMNYSEFVKAIWAKTIPAKNQLDMGSRFNDDGRKQLELLEEFERSLLAEEEQEHGV